MPSSPGRASRTAAVLAPAGSCVRPASSPRVAPPGASSPGPAVGAAAFAGRGRLAFVSSGRLYVLDGSVPGRAAVLRGVTAPAGAVAPAWSRDGRWLAFLVAPASPVPVVGSPGGTLWLARADGAGARPVLADAGPFSWSPARDVLAAAVTSPATGRAWLCELAPGAPPRQARLRPDR